MTPKLNLDVFDEVVEKPAIDLSAFDKVVEKKSPSESASSSTKPSSAQQSTSSLKELAAPPVSAESKVTTGLEPKSKYDELIEGTLEYRKSEGVNERLIEQDLAEQEEIAYQKQLKDKEERNKANTYISLINRPLSYLTEEQKQEYKEQMKARGIPNSVIESAWYEKERKEVNELGAQNKKQELADIQVEAQELGKKPEELFSERAVQWGVDRLNLEQKKLYDVQRKSEAGEPLTPQEQTLLGEYSQKKLYDQYGNLIDKPSPQDIKDEAEIGAMVVENKKLYKDQLKDIYEDKYSSLKYFDDLMNQVMTTPNGDFTPKELTSAAWAGQRSNPEMKPFIDEAFRVEKQRHAAWKEFEAMKRAYLLNVDPAKTGAGAGGRFTDALLEGTKESPVFGFVNELVDRKHELLSSNQNEKVFEQIANETGLPQTEVQKEKFKDTFYEKAADTFGGSLPVMGEIVLSTMAANYLGGISGVSRLSKLYNYQLGKKYGKGAEFLANLVDNTMKGYVTYAPTQETGATGVGEGSAQQFVDMLNPEKWAGGKYKKFFEYAARVGVGLTGETAQEYSGQFINALVENGADWEEVFAQTFGRTPEDQEDQLLLTMLQSALFSGAFNLGVLKDGLVALKKSTKPEAKQVTNVVEQVIEEREEDAKKPPEEPPASSVEEIKIEEPLAKTEKQAELSKIEEKQNKIKELLTQKPKEDAVQVEETTAGVLRDTGVRGEGELQGVEQQDQPKEPTELREPSEQREKVEEVTAIPEAETEGQPQIQTDETLQEERKGQEALLTETQPTPVSEEVAETKAKVSEVQGLPLNEMDKTDFQNWVGNENVKDGKIKVYRGTNVEGAGLRNGDFVTTNKDYAKKYGEHVTEHDIPIGNLNYFSGVKGGDPNQLKSDQIGRKAQPTELIYNENPKTTKRGKPKKTSDKGNVFLQGDKNSSVEQGGKNIPSESAGLEVPKDIVEQAKKEGLKNAPERPVSEKPRVQEKTISDLTENELIQHLKYENGGNKTIAWSKYVIAKGLRPEMDAKLFYKKYEIATPKNHLTNATKNTIKPTTLLKFKDNIQPDRRVVITERGDGYIKFIDEDGSHGSIPKKFIESETKIEKESPSYPIKGDSTVEEGTKVETKIEKEVSKGEQKEAKEFKDLVYYSPDYLSRHPEKNEISKDIYNDFADSKLGITKDKKLLDYSKVEKYISRQVFDELSKDLNPTLDVVVRNAIELSKKEGKETTPFLSKQREKTPELREKNRKKAKERAQQADNQENTLSKNKREIGGLDKRFTIKIEDAALWGDEAIRFGVFDNAEENGEGAWVDWKTIRTDDADFDEAMDSYSEWAQKRKEELIEYAINEEPKLNTDTSDEKVAGERTKPRSQPQSVKAKESKNATPTEKSGNLTVKQFNENGYELPSGLKDRGVVELIPKGENVFDVKLKDGKVLKDVKISKSVAAPKIKNKELLTPSDKMQVSYGGKMQEVEMPFERAAMKVNGNLETGEVGYVKTPDGKVYEISRESKKAKLLPEKLEPASSSKTKTNEKTKKTETKVLEKPIVKETPETLTKTESKLKQGLPEGTTIIKSSDSDRQVEIKVKKKAKEATDAAEDKGISLKDQKNDLVAKMQSAVAIMKGEEKITTELEKELADYGIRAISPLERESEIENKQKEVALKIKQTESEIKEEERQLAKKTKAKDFDEKWDRENKYRELKSRKKNLESEYIDLGDKIRGIGDNAQLEFQIKGDGTVRVGLEKLADTLEMVQKEFPTKETPSSTSTPTARRSGKTAYQQIAQARQSLKESQDRVQIAEENLAQAKESGNEKQVKLFEEELQREKDILQKAEKQYPEELTEQWMERFKEESKGLSVEDAYKKIEAIKGVPSSVSRAFFEKYNPDEKLTQKQAFEKFYNEEVASVEEKISKAKERVGNILKGKSGKAYDITGLTAELLGAIGELAVAYAEKYGKKGIEQFKKYINETFPNITDAEVTKIYDDATKDVKEPVEEKAEEKGEKKKTILTKRAYEGETREEVKKYLEEKGLTRKVVSQEERSKQAAEFIKEYGEETAIEAVKNFDVRGAQATAILAQVIKRINADMAKLKSTDVEQLDALAKEQAEVTALLEQEGFLAGELVGQLAYEYQDDALGFNVEKLIDDYKKENKGEISPEVEAKFRDLARENAALNEKIKQLESEKEKGQETIDNIRESVEREKKRRPKTSEQIKLATDKIVAKVKQGKIHRPNIFSAATPASLAWDTALDTVALAIKATGRTAEAIAKGLEYIKTTDWYKGLNDDKKQEAEDAYNEFWKVQPTFEVTEKGIKIPHSTIRDFVERGIDNIEDLTKKVHEVIKETNPEVTEREVRDAITGYGKTVNPNQEEVEMQIRKMKRIGRIISALEDVANKKRPLKSGQQRDKLDAQERALNKELREAMKDLPIDEQTEAEHLKTRLDAVKTNLRNRIEDLTKEIESGEKIPENKKPVEYDEEAKLLKAEKERLQAIHDEIFGKPELSDEQRINIATKATKKSIQELERRIAEGDLEAKKKESKTPNTPELEALRKKREDLKAEIKRLQDIANPPLSPEQKRLEQNKKAVQRSIAELERRIREKDFAPKEKKGIILDDELTRLKAEKLRLKEEYDKELYKVKLQNRTTKQKIVGHLWDAWGITRALRATGEFSFVLIQGLINTIAHPLQASQAMKNAIRFMFSPKKTEDWLRNLKSQEFYPMLKESKLAITEPNAEITAREELFYSGWTDMIWNNIGKIFGKNAETWQKLNPFHALERASTGYLDTQRVLRFLDGVEMLQEKGIEFNDNPQAYKDMADVINTFTGRASIGRLDQKLLSKVLFSPRNWASQIKTATPYAFYHFGKMRAGAESFKPSVAQKMAIADFSKFVGLTTTMVALAALSLNDDDDEETSVETDPRSSDFGKIKIGDTRIDPWGGRIQQIVLMSRLISDSIKRSGKVQKLGGNNPNRLELVLEMAANKLNPSASMIERYATTRINKEGERVDKYGKPYSISDDLQLYPIYWETISEILKDDPKALDGLLIFYAFFGGGVNVYETKKEEKPTLRKKVVRETVREKRETVR